MVNSILITHSYYSRNKFCVITHVLKPLELSARIIGQWRGSHHAILKTRQVSLIQKNIVTERKNLRYERFLSFVVCLHLYEEKRRQNANLSGL